MKKKRITRLVPPGTSVKQEIALTVTVLALAVAMSITFYLGFYIARYRDLVHEAALCKNNGIEMTMKMTPFWQLAGNYYLFFLAAVIIMALMCLTHWTNYFRESKSIYLLRRLPQKGALLRYTCGLPAIGAALGVICCGIVYLIFFAVYYLATPAAWLPV